MSAFLVYSAVTATSVFKLCRLTLDNRIEIALVLWHPTLAPIRAVARLGTTLDNTRSLLHLGLIRIQIENRYDLVSEKVYRFESRVDQNNS